MKAIVYSEYGPPEVLHMQVVETPVPQANEVLVKVHAASVTAVDITFRSGEPFFSRLYSGLFKPRNPILGSELSGVVQAVGQDVTLFKVGDAVLASTKGSNAYAEYVCVAEDEAIVHKPANMSFAEAAALPGSGITALPFLRDNGQIKSGDKVLIIGASGNVGLSAVQIAKYYGAEVTGIAGTEKIELIKAVGVDKAIDYKTEDFTRSGETYDIIFDAGGKSSFAQCKDLLKEDGIYLTTVPSLGIFLQMARTSLFGGRKRGQVAFTGLRPESEKKQDLLFLKELVEAGQLRTIIDDCYLLSEAAEAHRHAENGRKRGSVILTV